MGEEVGETRIKELKESEETGAARRKPDGRGKVRRGFPLLSAVRFRPVRFAVRRKFCGVFSCLSPGNVVKYSVSHKNARAGAAEGL